MTFALRDYQQRTSNHVCRLRGHWRTCLEAPTGSGKTVIMADILREPRRQLVVSHRCVLLDQIARTLKAAGIRFSYRASGYKEDPAAHIHLGMVQTELKRKLLDDIDILHIDEIHCMRGPEYRKRFDAYHDSGANILGYTATPSDLGDMVDSVYRVATVPELIAQGYLCPPRLFGCGQPDMAAVEQMRRDKHGEYLAGDVAKLVKPLVIFGPVLDNYRRLTNGTPFVLFAHSVKASIFWAQSLTAKGVPTAHIDGENVYVDGQFFKSDSTKRAEVFRRLESGDLKGVSNRFVLREGWDCPAVGHAIITAPFGTRKGWTQACGRVLRPHPGKQTAIIQDHSGSCIVHPPLDSDLEWDWQAAPGIAEKTRISEMRNDKEPEPIVCPQCMHVRYAGDVCPSCGFHYPKRARYVIQTDGTLRLVEGKSFKPRNVAARPGDAKVWERAYWGAKKYKPKRTFEQIYAYHAYKNNWQWLSRELPLMPKYEGDWFLPVGSVPAERLRA